MDHPLTPHPSPKSITRSGGTAEDLAHRAAARFDQYTPVGVNDNVVQLLNAFLDHLPKDGATVLRQDILDLEDDKSLRQLHDHLIDAILKPIRASGGKTPAPSRSPGSSVGEDITGDQPDLKDECLKRDGYRCKLTGLWDRSSVQKHKDVLAAMRKAEGRVSLTEVAHILPFALGKFDEDTTMEIENKAVIWECLYRYFPGLDNLISSETINIASNALTLRTSIHTKFGAMEFTLEETSQPQVYNIVRYTTDDDVDFDYLPHGKITLETSDPSIPMPSPFLLSVHARIGKILNVSGLAGRLDALMNPCGLPSQINPSGSTDIGSVVAGKLLILT